MKLRSPAAPLLLPFVTFGIYTLVWYVKTKGEMNASNTQTRVPTAWFFIIPFVNIWWLWRYATAVEEFTKGRMGKVGAFLLIFLLGVIGDAIVQSKFNATIRGN
ncbi:DUF4234 domain-containing protein [Leucobacter viscericola]|uniref:DUF4234 domain-containing protein n=1 Tax=Leucobacter viscericola TaxID=2714935 RepID=A0A6G7XBV3_9MICO|nr:DUF4234 domain-containing protein [Leucobacter viscericola]QIK61929.1 DUF4234 domain-containing protein [Leucobacter viscericola]